jgi:hypothetical protein
VYNKDTQYVKWRLSMTRETLPQLTAEEQAKLREFVKARTARATGFTRVLAGLSSSTHTPSRDMIGSIETYMGTLREEARNGDANSVIKYMVLYETIIGKGLSLPDELATSDLAGSRDVMRADGVNPERIKQVVQHYTGTKIEPDSEAIQTLITKASQLKTSKPGTVGSTLEAIQADTSMLADDPLPPLPPLPQQRTDTASLLPSADYVAFDFDKTLTPLHIDRLLMGITKEDKSVSWTRHITNEILKQKIRDKLTKLGVNLEDPTTHQLQEFTKGGVIQVKDAQGRIVIDDWARFMAEMVYEEIMERLDSDKDKQHLIHTKTVVEEMLTSGHPVGIASHGRFMGAMEVLVERWEKQWQEEGNPELVGQIDIVGAHQAFDGLSEAAQRPIPKGWTDIPNATDKEHTHIPQLLAAQECRGIKPTGVVLVDDDNKTKDNPSLRRVGGYIQAGGKGKESTANITHGNIVSTLKESGAEALGAVTTNSGRVSRDAGANIVRATQARAARVRSAAAAQGHAQGGTGATPRRGRRSFFGSRGDTAGALLMGDSPEQGRRQRLERKDSLPGDGVNMEDFDPITVLPIYENTTSMGLNLSQDERQSLNQYISLYNAKNPGSQLSLTSMAGRGINYELSITGDIDINSVITAISNGGTITTASIDAAHSSLQGSARRTAWMPMSTVEESGTYPSPRPFRRAAREEAEPGVVKPDVKTMEVNLTGGSRLNVGVWGALENYAKAYNGSGKGTFRATLSEEGGRRAYTLSCTGSDDLATIITKITDKSPANITDLTTDNIRAATASLTPRPTPAPRPTAAAPLPESKSGSGAGGGGTPGGTPGGDAWPASPAKPTPTPTPAPRPVPAPRPSTTPSAQPAAAAAASKETVTITTADCRGIGLVYPALKTYLTAHHPNVTCLDRQEGQPIIINGTPEGGITLRDLIDGLKEKGGKDPRLTVQSINSASKPAPSLTHTSIEPGLTPGSEPRAI